MTDPDEMECPVPCGRCGEWAELDSCRGEGRNLLCRSCYVENLDEYSEEADEE